MERLVDSMIKVGNVYKCKDDNVCVIIREINLTKVKYIVADSNNEYCHIEESDKAEMEKELKDFELIN